MSVLGIRFRVENGLCIAQVCETNMRSAYDSYSPSEEWRDAKPEDILDIGRWIEQQQRQPTNMPLSRAEDY